MTTIQRVVETHGVQLHQAGADALNGKCPFCGDPTAFHVRPAHEHWHCFACQQGGDPDLFTQMATRKADAW